MPSVSFPLRLEGGFLQRCDEREAVIELLRVISQTPHGSWAGCRRFGVRDLLEHGRTERNLPERLQREINAALEDLGVDHYRIEAVTPESRPGDESQVFSISVVSKRGDGDKFTVGF